MAAARAVRARPARTTTRPASPGANAVLYAAAGRRSALRYLLLWHTLRLSAQWVIDHPKQAGWWTLGLVAVGLTGNLVLTLSAATAVTWYMLGRERRTAPRWRPPTGILPWHRPLRTTWAGYFAGFLDARRCYVLALASATCQPMLLLTLFAPLAALVLVGSHLWAVIRLRVPPERDPRWNSEAQLLALLTDPHVAVLRSRPDGTPPWLSRDPAGLQVNELGEHITVTLSGAATWTSVRDKRSEIGSFWDLPAEQVGITHVPGWPEGMVTLSQLRPRVSTAGGLSPVALADNPDATEPVEVGEDETTGERIALEMLETNDLDTGVMGAGKTEGSRPVLGTYLLDRRRRHGGVVGTWVFGCDGKGSRKDYRHVARMAESWVWGTDDDAATKLTAQLQLVLRIVRYRNRVDEDGLIDWTPVLVWLEEFQDIRDAATAEQQQLIDGAMRRIVRMGRAVRVRVRIITQRSSVNDLPSSYRNLLVNRTAYRAATTRDYAIALGLSGNPDVRLPSTKWGQVIVRRPDGLFAVVPDRFPLDDWNALCERALQHHQGRPAPVYADDLPSTPGDTPGDTRDELDDDQVDPRDELTPGDDWLGLLPELLVAAHDAVVDEPLQTSALLDRLRVTAPALVDGVTARELGKRLAPLVERHPGIVERARRGGTDAGRNYRWHALVPRATVPATPGDPDQDGRPTLGDDLMTLDPTSTEGDQQPGRGLPHA